MINWSNEIGESRLFDTSMFAMLPLFVATLYYICTALIEYIYIYTYNLSYNAQVTSKLNRVNSTSVDLRRRSEKKS